MNFFQFFQSHCKVSECTKLHKSHLCNVCKNKDSTHFSKDCPMKKEHHCKVSGCRKNHQEHFCKMCGLTDSTHFSSKCPCLMGLSIVLPQTDLHPLELQQQAKPKVSVQIAYDKKPTNTFPTTPK